MPEASVRIGNQTFRGWQRVRVMRSIERASGSFDLQVTESVQDPSSRTIRTGELVEVLLEGQPVIAGHVDAVSRQHDAQSHSVRLVGRDRTADLVDCAPDVSPGQWRNLTVFELALRLAEEFGVGVTARADVGPPFDVIALNPGETAWALIEERCRYRQLLPVAEDGALVLTRAGQGGTAEALVLGENILGGTITDSQADRHSEYIVHGQSFGAGVLVQGEARAKVGRAVDAGVQRHRPLVVVAGSSLSIDGAQKRAGWEATVRLGRGLRAQIVVQGWTQRNGALWPVNARVPLRDSLLGPDREMLISEVEYLLDEQGSRTTLNLVDPRAFEALPEGVTE